MGFFSRLIDGKLFLGKKDPQLIVDFQFRELNDKRYFLQSFDLEFKQDVSEKNIPNSDVYGGILTITFGEACDEWLNVWMMNTHEKRDGRFRFSLNDGRISESVLLHISFTKAYCVSYHKVMDPLGQGLLTTLVISPESVKVGNAEFEVR